MKPHLVIVDNDGDLLAVLRMGRNLLGIWRGDALHNVCEAFKPLADHQVIDFSAVDEPARKYWSDVKTAEGALPNVSLDYFPKEFAG